MSVVAFRPNSPHARDIASMVHPQTNLRLHECDGARNREPRGRRARHRRGRDGGSSTAPRACGAPRSGSTSSGSRRSRTSRCAPSATTTPTGTARTRARSNPRRAPPRDRPRTDVEGALPVLGLGRRTTSRSSSPGTTTTRSGGRRRPRSSAAAWATTGAPSRRVSASGKADMHADFNLPLPMFRHTDTPHYYRNHEEGESEEAYSERLAGNLERLILKEGPETVGASSRSPRWGRRGRSPRPGVLRSHPERYSTGTRCCSSRTR